MTDGDEEEEAPREHWTKVVLYVLGVLQDLSAMGLIDSGRGFNLAPKAVFLFDQLHASGFRPAEHEAQAVIELLNRKYAHCDPGVLREVMRYDQIKTSGGQGAK